MDTNQDWRAQRDQRRQERWERRQANWERRSGPSWMGAVMGALMIGAGLLFLLNNLDLIYFRNIGDYWPVLLIAFGGAQLVNSGGRLFPGGFMVVLGGLFLAKNLGYIYSVGPFIWPLAIIIFGASMLMRNLYGPDWRGTGTTSTTSGAQSDRLQADSIFGGIDRKVVSQQFEGGHVSVVFGGGKIDLRGAGMKNPEAVLHVDAVFGGVQILVPETWHVDVRGAGAFGGYEDHTHKRPAVENAPRLIVKGSAVFGGVVVKN